MSTNEMLDRKMSAATDASEEFLKYIVNDLDFEVGDDVVEWIESMIEGYSTIKEAIEASRKVKRMKRICEN